MAARRVWIIDDDQVTTFYVRRLLEITYPDSIIEVFYSACHAFSSLSATNVNRSNPDIILLDIYMPVVSGWDFIKAFCGLDQAIQDKIDLFVMTSSIHPADAIRIKAEAKVKHHLVKPITQQSVSSLGLS